MDVDCYTKNHFQTCKNNFFIHILMLLFLLTSENKNKARRTLVIVQQVARLKSMSSSKAIISSLIFLVNFDLLATVRVGV